MALYYASGVDTADVGTFAVVVGGVASGTATVTAGTYCHISINSVASGYTALAAAVQTALQVVSGGFSCSFSTSTYAYTISHASSFTLTFSGDAGTNLRRALGFSGNVASTTSATSDVRPYYLMVPAIAGRTEFSDVYEPDDLAEEAVSDGGDAFIIAKDTTELWCDWVQQMESKAATLSRSAASSAPWTWEHFFKHCRGKEPFLVVDGSASNVYQLRADGAGFNSRVRSRVVSDFDDLWSLRFFTRDLGTL